MLAYGTWISSIGRSLTAMRLHFVTLGCLAVGVYWFGFSDPAREMWEDAQRSGGIKSLPLIALSCGVWVLTVGWAVVAVQQAFMASRAQQSMAPADAAQSELAHPFARAMKLAPLILATVAFLAVCLGAFAAPVDAAQKFTVMAPLMLAIGSLFLAIEHAAKSVTCFDHSPPPTAIFLAAGAALLYFAWLLAPLQSLTAFQVAGAGLVGITFASGWAFHSARWAAWRPTLSALAYALIACVCAFLLQSPRALDCGRHALWQAALGVEKEGSSISPDEFIETRRPSMVIEEERVELGPGLYIVKRPKLEPNTPAIVLEEVDPKVVPEKPSSTSDPWSVLEDRTKQQEIEADTQEVETPGSVFKDVTLLPCEQILETQRAEMLADGFRALGLLCAALALHYLLRLIRVIDRVQHVTKPRNGSMLLVPLLPLLVGSAIFGWWPVEVAAWLGTLSVIFLGLSAWTAFCVGAFVLIPVRAGLGPMPLLLPVILVACSGLNDNHQLIDLGPNPAVESETSLSAQYEAWTKLSEDRVRPVLVSAAGGGIRAAYWTAQTLAFIDDKSCGKFGDRIFAISGVSGGSVGAATYVAIRKWVKKNDLRNSQTCEMLEHKDKPLVTVSLVDQFFNQDLMAPIVASMLFPDGLQRLLPSGVLPWKDRGHAFDLSLEAAWERVAPGDRTFSQPFLSLYADKNEMDTPLLFLNSTSTEDGHRVVTSPINLKKDLVYWMFDKDLATAGLKLSTALHNSARFPILSPPATLLDNTGAPALRVADGGYFENSGGATLLEVMHEVNSGMKSDERHGEHLLSVMNDFYVFMTVTLIDSDPLGSAPSTFPDGGAQSLGVSGRKPANFMFELRSVLSALLAARNARGPLHLRDIMELTDDGGEHTAEFYFWSAASHDLRTWEGEMYGTLRNELTVDLEPPLSWYLANSTREVMKRALDGHVNLPY